MRNRPRPSLNRSNDGGVALKVLVLKLPILLIWLRQVLLRILDIIRKTCLRPRAHSIISFEATCFFFNVRVSTARFLHSLHRLLVHFSCLLQTKILLELLHCCTNVMISWFGWWYVVVLSQIFLQKSKATFFIYDIKQPYWRLNYMFLLSLGHWVQPRLAFIY